MSVTDNNKLTLERISIYLKKVDSYECKSQSSRENVKNGYKLLSLLARMTNSSGESSKNSSFVVVSICISLISSMITSHLNS